MRKMLSLVKAAKNLTKGFCRHARVRKNGNDVNDNDGYDDDDLDDDNDDDDDYDYHNLNSCPDLSMLKKCCCKIDHNYKDDNERTMPIEIILERKCLFPLSIYTQLK